MDFSQMLRCEVVAISAPLPYNFVAEVLLAEDSVHQQAQVVVGIRIAVQVNAAGGFEKVFQHRQPLGHVANVRKHLRLRDQNA